MVFHERLLALHRTLSSSIHGVTRPCHLPTSSSNTTNIREAIKKPDLSETAFDVEECNKLLESCIRYKSLPEAKKIHHHISRSPTISTNATLLEKVAHLYITCGDVDLARRVFDEIPKPSLFLWNALIRAYAWNGPFDRAVGLYHRMVDSGFVPNKFTFPFVLKACSGLLALEEGVEIHRHAERIGLASDLFVSTALMDMYMKCGCLDESRKVFDGMLRRDVVAWNAMIAGYSLHGMYDDTTSFVLDMQRMGVNPNPSTIVALLPVVGQVKELRQGKSIHGFCLRRCFDKDDVLVATALLDMYAKCECSDLACRVFKSMSTRNEVTWSAMIGGYVQCDRMIEALSLFNQMMVDGSSKVSSTSLACILRACSRLADLNGGKRIHGYFVKSGFLSDITIGNSLLSLYSKIGNIDEAACFFEEMEQKDTVSYSAIISGYVQNGNAKEALVLFRRMQLSNLDPDMATMIGVLPACSHLAALQHGMCSHAAVIVRGFASDVSISNSLIDMYAKCGRINHGKVVFDRMPDKDIVSWNTMIVGYGIHGLGQDAISLYSTMEAAGLEPDGITFICLIYACSHSGLVAEGKHWFEAMSQIYGITPRMEHYISMVDLLGRGGLLDEAHGFINRMPFEPDARVWGALLGACRIHENVKLGEEVSRMIQKLGPEGTGNYVLLSNIYSAARRFDEAAQVRIVQRDRGFKKSPGCSWVEIKGIVHAFVGGDQSHPQSPSIYQKLEDLLLEIKRLGYQADTNFVLQDVEEEEKEHALLYHSEKLAIAYALINLNYDQAISVTKNLRICGDCHTAIKFFTLVIRRSITVRDTSRFHHFKDGLCSCGDFW